MCWWWSMFGRSLLHHQSQRSWTESLSRTHHQDYPAALSSAQCLVRCLLLLFLILPCGFCTWFVYKCVCAQTEESLCVLLVHVCLSQGFWEAKWSQIQGSSDKRHEHLFTQLFLNVWKFVKEKSSIYSQTSAAAVIPVLKILIIDCVCVCVC